MKIFEVAGEGKLHGLTVMSLDKFVKKEDDVEESQVNEIDRRGFLKGMGAAAVAGAAGYKLGQDGSSDTSAPTVKNLSSKDIKTIDDFLLWNLVSGQAYLSDTHISRQSFEMQIQKFIKGFGPEGRNLLNSRQKKMQEYFMSMSDSQKAAAKKELGDKINHFHLLYPKFTESVEQGVAESDPSGIMHAAKNYNRSFLITAELAEGGRKTFRVRAQSERVAREKFDQHYNQARVISVKEEGLKEFALPGSGDSDSGRWYTDDELADIIGDDWFEDFDVSNDGFDIDAHGEKAKQNLASYANSWFDDKGYNVNVMGVDHNDVDHDLKWYIVGSFQNDNFADKDVEESNSAVIANTADRLSNKDDGRTAKLRAAGDARREQHLKGRDIAKNDRTSKDAWGDLKERASQLLSAEDRNGVITVIVQAPDGTKKSLANDNPNYINQWLSAKYGLTLPKSITSKFAGMNEAPGDFGLGANYRAIPDDEMQDLMGRSKNKQKTKRDKFDYPYIHGSNIEVKDEAGKKFDTEKLKAAIMTRPANILGQNAKMQHSETGTEAIFDIGLPALKGLAVNEKTGEFVVVDTCPGAGACQTYCYAMKGSYVMFKAVSMGLARMLNFLLNDPAGFADKLNSEIAAARSKYAKKGARIVVRWHDAGDFFSPEYMDMAYGVAKSNPDVGFYAYTKMGDVANAARPANFNMNFSQGAKSGQEKKVNITRTKHSKVVPKDMFFDLIARKGNELIKDAKGRMQFASPENLDKFKSTLAQKYAIDKDSILTYDQMMKIPVGAEPKFNVIVMPGDGDNSANRNDVVGSYLLFH